MSVTPSVRSPQGASAVPATPGRRAAEPATSGSTRATAAARARAETRGRLLAAGEALFAERGLHGVTTHDIAAHAGVAAGTFYNHFSDKGALFREITAEAMRELDERLQVGGHPERSLRESVRDHAEALVSFATDHRDLIRILFSREGDAAEAQADVLASLAARLEDGRRLAIERGEMPEAIDAGVLAQAVVGMWARVLAWWADDPDRIPGDRVVETLSQIQLTGTHPPRPSGPNAPSSRQPASG